MNEYAQEKANGPGIALLVVGILGLIGNLLGAILQLVGSMGSIISAISNGYGMEFWGPFIGSTGWSIAMTVVGFFVSFIVLFAGLRMRSLRSPGLVYAGSIMAALPCCVGLPCCCLGLPVGVWAIMTMQDEQVKAAFAE